MYEILGYANTWTASPGELMEFRVSCDGIASYTADLVKIRSGDIAPGAPGLKETLVAADVAGTIAARKQDTHAGSYGLSGAFAEAAVPQKTWLLAMMPTLPGNGRWQTVFGRWDSRSGAGYKLALDPEGFLVWMQGDGRQQETVRLGKPMVARQWYLVSVTVDATVGRMALAQEPLSPQHAFDSGAAASAESRAPAAAGLDDFAFVIAADLGRNGDKHHGADPYNGRIDSLTLLPCIAGADEARLLLHAPADRAHAAQPLVAWDFAQEIDSDFIVDAAAPGRRGELHNLPARGVPGIRWDATFHRWVEKPDHFAAVHFHEDGLGDAQWDVDFTYRVPADLPSGLYAMRLAGEGREYRITFIVRPAAGAVRQKIAFLASTATYMAYSNSHYRLDEDGMEMKAGAFTVINPWEEYLGEHRELGLSMYDTHSDGYGVYYASRLRPVFSMHLQERTWSLNADTHLLDWMEEKGFEYDVISDDMLHHEGVSALRDYAVVVTGAHPEYWTTPMWDAMTHYQATGGRLMYLGGNGFYWRCAWHPTKPWVMELRRAETGARYWETPAGESYHSFTGEYGGTWRRIGKAPQSLVGVGTAATGFDASSYYRRRPESHDPRAAFIFEGVPEEIIGDFGSGGGGAAGDEIDRADVLLGTPPHALVLARSEDHSRYYNLAPEETIYHHATINGQEAKNCHADLVFYECVGGGALFATGSITWCASLDWNGYQNNVSTITANVLTRFADRTPFVFPDRH